MNNLRPESGLVHKLAVAAVTLAIAGSFAWWGVCAWRDSRSNETVQLVDNRDEMEELLGTGDDEERELSNGSAESDAWPPALVRQPLDEELAKKFYKSLTGKMYEFKPFVYQWQKPLEFWRKFPEHPDGGWAGRVNQRGFRKDREVLEVRPNLRVVVTGDSHTAGLVGNSDSFPNVLLEELLREERPERSVEVLNAGLGGVSMYAYLGVLEYVKQELPFDVFVVTVYGGNDFYGMLYLQRFFNHRSSPKLGTYPTKRLADLRKAGHVGLAAQEVHQVVHFLNNPDDIEVSITTAASITAEIQRICDEAGIDLVCVYLPPAMRVQPSLYHEALDASLEIVGFEAEALDVSDRIADRWLEFLEERGIPRLDMRPLYSAQEEGMYWKSDHHINVRGHRVLSEALAPVIEALKE